MRYNVSIDVGGTFTDCILLDSEGKYELGKVPTIPSNPILGIMNVLKDVAEKERGLKLEQLLAACDNIIVGSTVATNAVLQNIGSKCCMITTKGFRDILEMRPMVKKDIYNFKLPKPRVLIPRYLRFEVEERTLASGETLTPINVKDAQEAIRKAKANKCEVVVIGFLHSYINTTNEEKMAEIVRQEYPEAEVVLSSKVLSRPPEYDRFSTAALSGYIHHICQSFLRNLEQRLLETNYKGTLLITTSNAGVTTVEQAIEQPIQLLASGPAAGVLAGSFLGKLANIENVITGDMGGTSYDVSILPKGKILTTNESMVGDQKNAAHIVDVRSIGAGGGSIAYLDLRGILRVGPESAAADPGPACYDRGGNKPTVTDADVLLGYIPSDYFLGGQLKLSKQLAEKVIQEQIANPLKIDLYEAAYSIVGIVNAAMANEMFLTCVSLGYDPRDYVFCPAGGGGATHGFDIAGKLGIKRIYIPKVASAFCAFGMMASADFRYEFSQPLTCLQNEMEIDKVDKIYRNMEKQGLALLKRIKGLDEKAIKIIRGADVRYFAQAYDIEAWMPETEPGKKVLMGDINDLFDNFHDRHEEIYGHADRSMMAGTNNLRLVARGERPKMKIAEDPKSSGKASEALKRTRSVYFKELGGFVDTPCYDGDKLHYGHVIQGHAIIEERTTTVVIPPKGKITVDRWGNYAGQLL
jgi:N-methylhydantoinase A